MYPSSGHTKVDHNGVGTGFGESAEAYKHSGHFLALLGLWDIHLPSLTPHKVFLSRLFGALFIIILAIDFSNLEVVTGPSTIIAISTLRHLRLWAVYYSGEDHHHPWSDQAYHHLRGCQACYLWPSTMGWLPCKARTGWSQRIDRKICIITNTVNFKDHFLDLSGQATDYVSLFFPGRLHKNGAWLDQELIVRRFCSYTLTKWGNIIRCFILRGGEGTLYGASLHYTHCW